MTEFDPSFPCTDPGKILSCFLFAYLNVYDLGFLFIWPFVLVVDVTENNEVLSLFSAGNVGCGLDSRR